MNIGFYAGSFDPFTMGHMHVVKTASNVFDKLVIGIGINNKKARRYDKEIMKNAIEQALKDEDVDNVDVITYEGLSVDAAKDNGCNFLVRGIRDDMDYYYEENNLHMFLIMQMRDYDTALAYLEAFLPYIDNWAVCDIMSPKVFAKHKEELLAKIKTWSQSSHVYTCRFGIETLMTHYLDKEFKTEYLEIPASVRSDEYYVKMMVAWFFATALAKQWEATIPYIEQKRLAQWTHNKTVQKAIESYRISSEQKEYLRSLKIK